MARIKTRYVGVYYRFAQKRVGLNGKLDKCFDIQYKKNDKYIWEKIGWVSEGYTVEDAIEIRGQRVKELRHPELKEYTNGFINNENDNEISPKTLPENEITLDEAWDAFYSHWIITNLKDTKLYYTYQKHWKSHFGSRRIRSITTKEIEEFTHELLKKLKPGSVKNILVLFQRIFNKCKLWEMIPLDARCPITIPKCVNVENPRERFLTYKEASILLDALQYIECNLYIIAKISLHSGMRLSEILNLRIYNINFDIGNISIENGKTGNRTAYISNELKKILMNFINAKSKKYNGSDYIFTNNSGKKLTKSHVSHTFARTVDDLGLNDNIISDNYKVVFHTLRHTFCSWLAIQGVPLYTISNLVGHKSLAMTQRYAKLSPDCKRNALQYIDLKMHETSTI
jgi:integrase